MIRTLTFRQFKLAQKLIQHRPTPDEALIYNQRTFGSMCAQGYIGFDADKWRFMLTETGYRCWLAMDRLDLRRPNNNGKFSKSVRLPKARLRVMRRSA